MALTEVKDKLVGSGSFDQLGAGPGESGRNAVDLDSLAAGGGRNIDDLCGFDAANMDLFAEMKFARRQAAPRLQE